MNPTQVIGREEMVEDQDRQRAAGKATDQIFKTEWHTAQEESLFQ